MATQTAAAAPFSPAAAAGAGARSPAAETATAAAVSAAYPIDSPMYLGLPQTRTSQTTPLATPSNPPAPARVRYCSSLVVALCMAMGFPWTTRTTSLSLLQRVLHTPSSTRSLDGDSHLIIACVLLACKVEETVKKARDLILALHSILGTSDQNLVDFDSPDIDAEKRGVIMQERLILESVCFDFHQLKHAQKYVIQFAKMNKVPEDVSLTAWFIADQAYHCKVCIQYPAHFIALAALYLGCQLHDSIAISSPLTADFVHMHFGRLTGVVDAAIQIISHFQQNDGLEKTVDLQRFASLSKLLEKQLADLLHQAFAVAHPVQHMPPKSPPKPQVPNRMIDSSQFRPSKRPREVEERLDETRQSNVFASHSVQPKPWHMEQQHSREQQPTLHATKQGTPQNPKGTPYNTVVFQTPSRTGLGNSSISSSGGSLGRVSFQLNIPRTGTGGGASTGTTGFARGVQIVGQYQATQMPQQQSRASPLPPGVGDYYDQAHDGNGAVHRR
ncbi:RNA polymerase II C-terminal domain kinase beta subunit [Entophlyctis luteolus]|nr:RNA polymerase II C-terminal domain kinase beta subunit [Entophlyctis luteolus]KAJ3354597.1 RNA polymerase II C-terminal domain kinase beta subunit [Entophlyctis luteolus]